MENPFLGIEAALFDLDGTLVETHIDFPLMKREMLRLAKCYGVSPAGLSELDILTVVEIARDRLVAANRAEEALLFRVKAFAILEEIEVDQCANPAEIPGARQLLDALSRNSVRIGIVTRNCTSVARTLIDFARLKHDVLLTRDDVSRTKPDPLHLHEALRMLDVPDPHLNTQIPELPNAVMIGDHWMDVQAGRAAGMKTVGIDRGREPGFYTPAQPDLLVNEIADLLVYVQ